jgi:hypothetical protein
MNIVYSASYRVALPVTLDTRQVSAAGGTIIFCRSRLLSSFTIHRIDAFSLLRASPFDPPTTLLAHSPSHHRYITVTSQLNSHHITVTIEHITDTSLHDIEWMVLDWISLRAPTGASSSSHSSA